MKLAIKKIQYIPVSSVQNWGHLGKSSYLKVSSFISGTWTDLAFTPLSASLTEEWIDSSAGVYSQVTLSGNIRANKSAFVSILSALVANKNIFKVTTIEGPIYIIGSVDTPGKFLPKLIITELTTSEYQFTITCKSRHGLILESSS